MLHVTIIAQFCYTGCTMNNATLNKLRAAVLGANDGIVSTSSVVMGVAGAGAGRGAIFTAGLAALVAGALSMAVGEYVSVSSQSDAEKVHIKKKHGGDASGHEITNPLHAALASLIAFTIGGFVPFLAIIASPEPQRILITVAAVFLALLLTGYLSATVGKASRTRAMLRVVIGGLLAMVITYYVGVWFGTSIG